MGRVVSRFPRGVSLFFSRGIATASRRGVIAGDGVQTVLLSRPRLVLFGMKDLALVRSLSHDGLLPAEIGLGALKYQRGVVARI